MDGPMMTRRDALRVALLGSSGLMLARGVAARAQAPAAGAAAKAVIQIWMWGGPSHLDTFDPKPDAGYDYCGPLAQDVATNVDGVRINASLPLLAQQADKYAIIRSMTHGSNAHETASYIVQTGRDPAERVVYPCAGAVVSLMRGYGAGYTGRIPPYIVLTKPQGRFSEAGVLGQTHKPFATGGDPNRDPFAVEGIVAEGMTPERQRERRELLHALDSLGAAMPESERFARLDACEEKAYELILGDAGKVFDLTQEPAETRDRYGRNTFGQSCLAARRLVEQGVPWVTINYEGWDTHKRHFETMAQKLPQMDQGMATLLQDLSDRGLLESTVVWWGGEFGRGPKVDWGEPWNGGRSHYGQCFSTVLAGGGFRGGAVVGASDARGEEPAERPVHPRTVLRSIYERLGVDPDAPLPNPAGVETRIMPLPPDAGEGADRLGEIM